MRHVPIALENSPKRAQNMAEKCLKFRNSSRKLLVVFNYLLADFHKYS